MWEKELEIAKKVAVKAGEAIMEIYADETKFGVEYKDDASPLTTADKKANAIIVETLRANFPDYAILSEEEKDNPLRLQNDLCFVVDPLDGTKEFIKRNGQFTVNIALAYQHKSVMGVIYVPADGRLYYAADGIGAFLCENGIVKQIHVSEFAPEDKSMLRTVMSGSHGCPEMEALIEKYHLTELVRMGSSLKGCLIAEGKAEIYYRHNPTMEWDTAAMQCIVEQAGGIFREMDGNEMRYNRSNSLNEKGFFVLNCKDNYLQ